jgi:hypothetical protein
MVAPLSVKRWSGHWAYRIPTGWAASMASASDGSYRLNGEAAGVTWSSAAGTVWAEKPVRYPVAAFEAGGAHNARTPGPRSYTVHNSTACFKEAMGSLVGTNSWAKKP